MPAFRFSRTLLAAALGLASLGALRAAPASVDYFVPVTYDMVITRASTTTTTATSERSRFNVEIFTNRDLLRVILGAQTPAITDLRNWSLVARGNSATFTSTSTIASLEIGARHRDGRFFPLPDNASLSLSLETPAPTSSVRVIDRGASAENTGDDTLVSENRNTEQIAVLEQELPAVPGRTLLGTGTLTTTGYLSHGAVYEAFVFNRETIGPVYRPSTALYRAVGTFAAAGDSTKDGLVEIQISFGALSVRSVQAD